MADAAAYKCELDSNRQLHLSNEGAVTAVALSNSSPGQQQRSSNRFTTGQWTAVPALYRLDQGLLIIIPATSTYYLQIKGGQVQMLSGSLSEQMADQLQQAQPVAMQPDDRARTILDSPMQPMTPLRMNKNPMSMSMGDMKMTMGETGLGEISPGDMKLNTQPDPTESRLSTSSASSHSQGESGAAKVRRFCSQCGSAVALGDRFFGFDLFRLTIRSATG